MADDAAALTGLLREGQDRAWITLRAALLDRGVDPRRSVLALSAEQGDDSEFSVLVTDDSEVVTCSWVPSTGVVVEWTWITSWWRDSPYRSDVEQAFSLRPST